MSARAFVLIQTALGMSREVEKKLQEVPGVESAEVVSGPHDIIAVVEAENINRISDIVLESVDTIPGVIRRIVCPSVFQAGLPQAS